MNALVGSHIKTPGGVYCHTVAPVVAIEPAERAPVHGRAVRADIEGQNNGVVGHVESPPIRAKHDSIRTNVFVGNGANHTGRVHVICATYRKIRAALPVRNEIVKASERLSILEAI